MWGGWSPDSHLTETCLEHSHSPGPTPRGWAEASLLDGRQRRPRGQACGPPATFCPWLAIKGLVSPSAQSPPRGPGPSVSAGRKACWSTTVAHPGTTSMCPSAMIWATSRPCSVMERATSAGAWTRTAERCRAHARSLASRLRVSVRAPGSPQTLMHLSSDVAHGR